jgi:hypothetical protein
MTDPQDAIDAEAATRAAERDPRIEERTAGERQEGIPFIGAGPGDPGLLTVTVESWSMRQISSSTPARWSTANFSTNTVRTPSRCRASVKTWRSWCR